MQINNVMENDIKVKYFGCLVVFFFKIMDICVGICVGLFGKICKHERNTRKK